MHTALEVVLELVRGKDAAVDEGYPLGDTEYLLRHGDGEYRSARFPWSPALHQDLQALHRPQPDPQALQRVGNVLRTFFDGLGWAAVEAEILEALASKPAREVRVTFRCGAGELCRLPLELLTLQPSGHPLARTEGLHVQWEWPDTASAPDEPPAPPEGGVLLFAWSTAGGALNSQQQLRILQRARESYQVSGTVVVEEPNTSLDSLKRALEAVRARKEAVAVLHLLCHGGRLPGAAGGVGLWLDGPQGGVELVDPARFASALQLYAGLVRCVVVCACEGASLGDSDNVLGSVAQRLHRDGFPAVVGSRVPLSTEGAEAFTTAFSAALLAGEPLHRAVAAGRSQLGQEWAALQVYARAADGPQFPVIFRPYRGLRSFEAKHRRFFFGREALTQELLERVEEADRGERPRFQVVVGTSGCGKSSLVKAGLVPALPATWQVVMLRPGGDEQDSHQGLTLLARRLRAAQSAALEPAPGSDEPSVMFEARRLRERRAGRPMLVVVDQLEEALRLPAGEPQRFLGCLFGLARDEALRIVVLGIFRADLLERAQNMALEEGVSLQRIIYRPAHGLFVPGLSPGELLEIIERPLEAVGLRFEPDVARPLRDEAGKEPGLLPLLEHALDTLWRDREGKRLTRAAYERLGLTGALSRRLDVMWDALPDEQQRQGRRLLAALVDIADEVSLSTRRRRRARDVRPSGQVQAQAFDAVLERLAAERLVVRGQGASDAGESWVEIAHEALIRRWPRLQGWLWEGLADHQLERELEKSAKDWAAHRAKKDEGTSFLPGGSRLEAFEALQARVGPLPALQRDFIAAASAGRSQEKRRSRLIIAALSVGLLFVSGLSLLALAQWRTAVSMERLATAELKMGDDPRLALALLKEAYQFAPKEQVANVLTKWWSMPGRATLRPHNGAVNVVAFKPDGHSLLTADANGVVRLWDVPSGAFIRELAKTESEISVATFSPSGNEFVAGLKNGTIMVLSTNSGALKLRFKGHSGRLTTATYSPDGSHILTTGGDSSARLWSANSGVPIAELDGHDGPVLSAAYSSTGQLIATGGDDGSVRLWEGTSGRLLVDLHEHAGAVLSVAFDASSRLLISASADRTACVWDIGSGYRLINRLRGHLLQVSAAALHPDGKYAATASRDSTARIWDVQSGNQVFVLTGHDDEVTHIRFSHDGRRLLTAGTDGVARVWDSNSGKLVTELSGHRGAISSVALSSDGRFVATSSVDRTARLWQISSGTSLAMQHEAIGPIRSVAFSSESRQVFVATATGGGQIWDVSSGELVSVMADRKGSIIAAHFSVDSRHVLTASDDGTLRIWESTSGSLVQEVKASPGRIYAAAFSPNATSVAVVGVRGLVRVWDVWAGKMTSDLSGHRGDVFDVTFSPSGDEIATCGADRSVRLWSATNNNVIAVLLGHTGSVVSVAYDRAGQRLVTSSFDRTAIVWERGQEKGRVSLLGHSGPLRAAMFGADDRLLLTASADGTAKVWDAASGKLLADLVGHSGLVRNASFSPNGGLVLTTSHDGTARIWETSGRVRAIFRDSSSWISLAKFSPDGKYVVTASWDGVARLHESSEWAPIDVQVEDIGR